MQELIQIILSLPGERTRLAKCFASAVFYILLYIFIACPQQVCSQVESKKITINLKDVTIESVLKKIEEQSEYRFIYNHDLVHVKQKISISLQNAPVVQAIDKILHNQNIVYQIKGTQIILRPKNAPESDYMHMAVKTIEGSVSDIDGNPLLGSVITVKETSRNTVTDKNGRFNLLLIPNEQNLIISYVGMTTKTVPLNGNTKFHIELTPRENTLEDVVVTGYQTLPKERATGSFAVVDAKTIQNKLQPDLISRLEGQVPNVTIINNRLSIRGDATLNATFGPLIVVDGMPFVGNLQSINPAIIKDITFLKDAAAASIYGAQAANGVMVITTLEGGKDGKTRISYNGTVTLTAIPDYKKLQLINSKELVDLGVYGFSFKTVAVDARKTLNPIDELMLKRKNNGITAEALESGLNHYRNLDNRQQLRDFYLQTGLSNQHNLVLSGGNKTNSYLATFNYQGNRTNNKYSGNNQYGFTLRDNIRFYKWLEADFDAVATISKGYRDVGIGSYTNMLNSTASYVMLQDENGNTLNLPREKSEYELQRLRSIGLKDETYSPIANRGLEMNNYASNYFRMQGMLRFIIMPGLNWEVRYQQERNSSKDATVYDRESYTMRRMINDAAQYNPTTKAITYNVPNGGALSELRSDLYAYTIRTQLNFTKAFDRHGIDAIAGAERRLARTTSTGTYYFGYDDQTLAHVPVNPQGLSYISGTESLTGDFSNSDLVTNNYVRYADDRFISAYGNASYTYVNRYTLSGSIRIDQSNLFGTDPKLQYKPLWSAGGSWLASREQFMQNIDWVNMLKLRLTYGIGGNVSKSAIPFLVLTPSFYDALIGGFASSIATVPNKEVRWEKTATTNIGIDFGLFQNKVSGTIEYYNRKTTDLLAFSPIDLTLGRPMIFMNAGNMTNKGLEVSLRGNFSRNHFQWNPSIIFGYNKSNLTDVYSNSRTIATYTASAAFVKGYPLQAVFAFPYAGLNELGRPQYYNQKGDRVASSSKIEDLVYMGTKVPVYNGAFSNKVSYKNLSLSFMFIYKGGHVFRTQAPDYVQTASFVNSYRGILNLWKNPGDESRPETSPGFSTSGVSNDARNMWYSSDQFVRDASFLKLRELIFSYNLNPKLLHHLKMTSLSLNFQVRNPWTVWVANKEGVDPEALSSLLNWTRRGVPEPVSGSVGIIVNF